MPKGKEHPEAIKESDPPDRRPRQPGKAYVEWSKLVKQLAEKIQQPGMKEQYFECYYYMTEAWLKHALALPARAKTDDGVKRAASFIVKLEGPWPDLGNDESKARFIDLLDREPAPEGAVRQAEGRQVKASPLARYSGERGRGEGSELSVAELARVQA